MYEKFEELLNKYNVKAADVCRETGLSPTTISDWKSGKSKPKVDKLIKIADYFDISIEELLGKSLWND